MPIFKLYFDEVLCSGNMTQISNFVFPDLENQEVEAAEELVSRLQVFEAVCGHVHARLREASRDWALACCVLVRTRYTAVRHMAARALAALCRHHAVDTMHTLIHEVKCRKKTSCFAR